MITAEHFPSKEIQKEILSKEEKWQECLNSDKLSTSSVKFMTKMCKIEFSEKLKSTPFWDISEKVKKS